MAVLRVLKKREAGCRHPAPRSFRSRVSPAPGRKEIRASCRLFHRLRRRDEAGLRGGDPAASPRLLKTRNPRFGNPLRQQSPERSFAVSAESVRHPSPRPTVPRMRAALGREFVPVSSRWRDHRSDRFGTLNGAGAEKTSFVQKCDLKTHDFREVKDPCRSPRGERRP
jgi:hypothetical protein